MKMERWQLSLFAVMLGLCVAGCGENETSKKDPEAKAKLFQFLNRTKTVTYPYSKDAKPSEMYLQLMKLSLSDLIYEDDMDVRNKIRLGSTWPSRALTMIGLKRLDNIQFTVEDVIKNNVPGDLLEAGAWRGGATIFMRSILKYHGVTDRVVYVADSFEGLPAANAEKYPIDAELDYLSRAPILAVSIEDVRLNFERYGLLDDQVRFLKGWFKDTLAPAPIEKLAILRLDGDLYESTMDTLVPLYPKLSPGGYCIVDDYFLIDANREATDDYRKQHGITEKIMKIDQAGAYWQKKR